MPESSTQPTLDKVSPTPKHKFEGHEDLVWSFVFLHDNVHIVSGSADGTMRKWDCDTGHLVGEPWKGEGGAIYALALSPDGKTIACGRDNGHVQRWDTEGKMMEGVCKSHSMGVRSLAWSPTGGHLASGSYDGTILIRKAERGEVEVGPMKTNQGWVHSLAYSPSGERIASGGSSSDMICIWNSETGELLDCIVIKNLGHGVKSVVWSLDGLYCASDNFARVFDISGTLLHRFDSEHDDSDSKSLWSIALSPKYNVLACVGLYGAAQLWDTASRKSLGQPFRQADGKNLRCVSFSPDGRYLAYSGIDMKITLWMIKDIAPQLAVCASITIFPCNKLHSRNSTTVPTIISPRSQYSHNCVPIITHRITTG
jgi:WD40 repeat protein